MERTLSNESGKAAAWALLGILSLSAVYFGYSNGYILQSYPRFYIQLGMAVGGILCIFVLGAQLSISASGGRSKGALAKRLHSDVATLRSAAESVSREIKQIESEITQNGLSLSPHGYECLTAAHRIRGILEKTAKDSEELIASDNSYALADAQLLIDQQTVSFEGLRKISIGGNLVPLLTPIEWVDMLPTLMHEVKLSMRRAAA